MKIAIFGGSFDPPHLGHEAVINEALKSLHVDKLFVIPTYLNPFKKEFFAPSTLRLKWLEKLFTCKEVEILDFEVKQKRAVPTIETVEYLQNSYNLEKIYLIIGADNFATIESWHRYDELKQMVEFVVASRDETILPMKLKKLSINAKISSSKLRSNMNISFIPHKIADEVIEFYKDKNGK